MKRFLWREKGVCSAIRQRKSNWGSINIKERDKKKLFSEMPTST